MVNRIKITLIFIASWSSNFDSFPYETHRITKYFHKYISCPKSFISFPAISSHRTIIIRPNFLPKFFILIILLLLLFFLDPHSLFLDEMSMLLYHLIDFVAGIFILRYKFYIFLVKLIIKWLIIVSIALCQGDPYICKLILDNFHHRPNTDILNISLDLNILLPFFSDLHLCSFPARWTMLIQLSGVVAIILGFWQQKFIGLKRCKQGRLVLKSMFKQQIDGCMYFFANFNQRQIFKYGEFIMFATLINDFYYRGARKSKCFVMYCGK